MFAGSLLRRVLVVVPLLHAGCGGDDGREPGWPYISAVIIQPTCATSSCHGRAAAVAGLDLSNEEDGHRSLLALRLPPRGTGVELPRPIVVPHNPDQSRLVNMLRGKGARRMPPDRPLPEADIRLIERWILAGASRE